MAAEPGDGCQKKALVKRGVKNNKIIKFCEANLINRDEMALSKHTKTATVNHPDMIFSRIEWIDIVEPWRDIQQKEAFWSVFPFISLSPHNFTTAPPYPLLLTWARQSRTEHSWVPTNLVPTTKFGTTPHPLPPPPLQNVTQRLNPVWNSSELGYLPQKNAQGKGTESSW